MFTFFWSLLFFIIALGVLVAVHEWGHFIVARRCGVKVQRFSIGFGKALWRRTDKLGTEYVIAAIPLGGYVKMLDERAEDVPQEDQPYAFNRQNVYKRIAIIAAGPITNFLFAIIALMLMYMIGVETVKPVVGEVKAQSIAEQGGLTPGMQIRAVGGRQTLDWEAVNLELVSHIGDDELTMQVSDNQGTAQSTLTLSLKNWQFDPDKSSALSSLGLVPFRPQATTTLAYVAEDSPAAAAGLAVDDKILAIQGTPVQEWEQIVDRIASHPGQTRVFSIERNGYMLEVDVLVGSRDVDGVTQGYLGIVPLAEAWPESYLFTHQYGPVNALVEGAGKTWRLMVLSVEMIGKLVTGDVSVSNLSGPISIAQGAGISAGYGLVYFLSFLALISVNLGIINLLPLPVLDGGHLLYYFIELLTGKPVPESVQDVGFRIGGALLMLLMTIAIVNDIARL
ncbi:sigma E protease regulator RseP [Aliiglaciecola sp. CAU 1673]|uniref:sigma E protease regulator RseP n=1 Tax=Aliiglaciecola sp. CAU 1673 TaxID=3032595 RepID=UPI0023DA2E73|nr:sigma E protease regulator RseP [Aliiglaciecola sp. CAU 1673]MDF2179618.1 sigma E protease regulator RseP [Aliiglaciecola sp. CAU 1673]